MNIAISIIIPVYNVEKYLRECLDSVMEQTFTDFEAICVNDGSTDGSLAILEEYAAKDNRFKIISQVNSGQGKARNEGVKAAVGKYIWFIDSDDWIEPETMQICLDAAEKNDLDELIFDFIPEYEQDTVKKHFSQNSGSVDSSANSGKEYFITAVMGGYYYQSPCTRFIKRDFFVQEKLSYMSGVLYEDELLHVKADLLAKRVMYIPAQLYHYRIRSQSTMTSVFKFRNVYSYWFCEKNLNQLISKYSDDPELLKALFVHRAKILRHTAWNITQVDPAELAEGIKKYPEIESFLFDVYTIQGDLHYFDLTIQEHKWDDFEKVQAQLDFVLHHSISYKIGKFIMWLPQKICAILKGSKNA